MTRHRTSLAPAVERIGREGDCGLVELFGKCLSRTLKWIPTGSPIWCAYTDRQELFLKLEG